LLTLLDINSSKLNKQSTLIVLLLVSTVSGMFTAYKANQPVSGEALVKQVNINLDRVIRAVDDEANVVVSNLRNEKNLPNTQFHFLVLNGDSIVAWNDHHFIPPPSALTDIFELKFIKTGNGEFLVKKWAIESNTFLIAIIPLHIQYKITNNYLTPYWNKELFETFDLALREPLEIQGYPILHKGNVLFRIFSIPNSSRASGGWQTLTILSFSLALISLLVLLIWKIEFFSKKHPGVGFLALLSFVMIVRVTMILSEFPARYSNSQIFDAKNFASSELNPSLGDLLLNSIALMILCLYLFRNYYRFEFIKFFFSTRVSTFLVSVFSIICVLFGMLYPFVVMQTIYNNSTITLSISQSIHFDPLRILAWLSMTCAWISSFLFMHVFLRLLMHERKTLSLYLSFVIGCFLFIEINKLSGQIYFWPFVLGVSYIVIVVSFSLYNSLQKFRYTTFAYFFTTIVCFALSGMFAVEHFEQQRTLQNQLRFASNFLDERDYFGEYLLHEATERITSDAFIQGSMASPFLGKEVVIQKIRQVSLSGYFNRYNVEVFLFNSIGEPMTGSDTTKFSTLINQYDHDTFKTEYEGIYSVASTQGDFSKKYVVVVPVQKNESPVGFVIIKLVLKRIIPENVYPELLIDNRFQQGYQNQDISYAIVADQHIQYTAGDFNYDSFVQRNMGDPRLYTRGMIHEKYVHIAMEDINGRIAIISTPAAPLIYWLADFSFQVILGMVIILLLLLVQGVYNYSTSKNLYLAARIQLILNLAFFLPLIAVSIITLRLITQSSQEQLNSEYLSKANRFGNTITNSINENKGDVNDFSNEFTTRTVFANLDANVFYPNGKLMATSQPLIFENHLLAPYINSSAYKRIENGDKAFVSTEQVGNLKFYVAYCGLFSEDSGARVGILGIPFFQSAYSLERMQITILANILSIFTLIFIVLLVISFLVTKWLTAPLRVITKTMGRVSLTGVNKPLQWQADDEIGFMAREYNQMLLKLNDSKDELERNQRERAWREIAQQVAHEIKNPLTPMKLTLQQLERTLQNENDQHEKLSKAVSSLLTQVNFLDDIASSFSSFAKMPEPVMAEVELIDLLTRTINLHTQEGTILFQPVLKSALVLADEQLLGRIFSNIILNGIQAVQSGVPPKIHVQIEMYSKYRITFSDNGKGIDPDLLDKIFLPHFTTKQSGSGLGLAISKQGIEQMGGGIWFETSAQGTSFIIELPQLNVVG
jgi:two-component system nitrogen regulation sensor histidine kinase NtrY